MIQIQFLWSFYCQNKSHKKYNLHVHSPNTSRYGNNSLRVRRVHVWNSLPENIYELKDALKGWYGLKCHLYSSYILKTAERQFYCMIMRRYFSRMHQKKGSGRSLGADPFFRDGLCFFYFLLAFYFIILILYTTDFNPTKNKDIIIIIIIIIIILIIRIIKTTYF